MSTIVLVTLLLGLSCASGHHGECEEMLLQEWAEEKREDTKVHDCRSCEMIEVDADANCPRTGYDCDDRLPITSEVLRPNDRSCANLRCHAANATLAVAGVPVRRIRCENRAWKTGTDDAMSAVCARRCGRGVCALPDASVYEGQDTLGPLAVKNPDTYHPCAWGDCQLGAVASDGKDVMKFTGLSSFACSGDGTWRYTGPGTEKQHLTEVSCVIKEETCTPYKYDDGICSATTGGALCAEPTIVKNEVTCSAPTPILSLFGPSGKESPTRMFCDTNTGTWMVTSNGVTGTVPPYLAFVGCHD